MLAHILTKNATAAAIVGAGASSGASPPVMGVGGAMNMETYRMLRTMNPSGGSSGGHGHSLSLGASPPSGAEAWAAARARDGAGAGAAAAATAALSHPHASHHHRHHSHHSHHSHHHRRGHRLKEARRSDSVASESSAGLHGSSPGSSPRSSMVSTGPGYILCRICEKPVAEEGLGVHSMCCKALRDADMALGPGFAAASERFQAALPVLAVWANSHRDRDRDPQKICPGPHTYKTPGRFSK
jgi:hypothetical protein